MNSLLSRALIILLLLMPHFLFASARAGEGTCVILLHGLARSSLSMMLLEYRLEKAGYALVNKDYDSTTAPVEELAIPVVSEALDECKAKGYERVSFVTHSMGGILLRYFYLHSDAQRPESVVMLGPPNQGSEVVDNLKDVPGFELINGPAGMQLGTRQSDIPKSLGPVDFELGVIAGTQSINWILSSILPETDDGKVTVDNTRVEGMCSFLTMPTTHPLMMNNADVTQEVIHFLKNGSFHNPRAENGLCRQLPELGSAELGSE